MMYLWQPLNFWRERKIPTKTYTRTQPPHKQPASESITLEISSGVLYGISDTDGSHQPSVRSAAFFVMYINKAIKR